MDNNKNNDPINELLNKKQKGTLDDFEREALEGFETLSSAEANELKASLDKHMREEVFVEKKATRVYWLAAAALALVMGLSVIFVMNNGSKEEGLAITTLTEDKAPEGMMKETAAAEDAASQPNKTEEKNDGNGKDIKQLSNAVTNDPASIADQKGPGAKGLETKTPVEQEINAQGSAGKMGESQKNSGSGIAVTDEEESKAANKAAKTDSRANNNGNLKDAPASATIANPDRDANLELSKLKKEEEKPLVVSEKGKAEGRKDDNSDVRLNLANNTAGAVSTNVVLEPKKEAQSYKGDELAREKKKSRAVRKKSAEPAASTGESKPADKVEEAANDRSEAKEQTEFAGNIPATPKAMDDAKSNESSGYVVHYSGGEAAFKKDLNAKLTEKGLNKKFDAVLFVNNSGKVEKVNFTNKYGMNDQDSGAIEKVLRSLDKFDAADKNGLTEIKVNYRP